MIHISVNSSCVSTRVYTHTHTHACVPCSSSRNSTPLCNGSWIHLFRVKLSHMKTQACFSRTAPLVASDCSLVYTRGPLTARWNNPYEAIWGVVWPLEPIIIHSHTLTFRGLHRPLYEGQSHSLSLAFKSIPTFYPPPPCWPSWVPWEHVQAMDVGGWLVWHGAAPDLGHNYARTSPYLGCVSLSLTRVFFSSHTLHRHVAPTHRWRLLVSEKTTVLARRGYLLCLSENAEHAGRPRGTEGLWLKIISLAVKLMNHQQGNSLYKLMCNAWPKNWHPQIR